jgi:hypothetical protein
VLHPWCCLAGHWLSRAFEGVWDVRAGVGGGGCAGSGLKETKESGQQTAAMWCCKTVVHHMYRSHGWDQAKSWVLWRWK